MSNNTNPQYPSKVEITKMFIGLANTSVTIKVPEGFTEIPLPRGVKHAYFYKGYIGLRFYGVFYHKHVIEKLEESAPNIEFDAENMIVRSTQQAKYARAMAERSRTFLNPPMKGLRPEFTYSF